MPKPCVKWVGGKTKLVSAIQEQLPDEFHGYCEPFFGGGAVFFSIVDKLEYMPVVLADRNEKLIRMYEGVKNYPNRSGFIVETLSLSDYYDVREKYNAGEYDHLAWHAAAFMYLNQMGFNGLYRENSKGEFNVPKGTKKKPVIDLPNLTEVSNLLKSVQLKCQSFEDTPINKGWLYYFDPPYMNMYSKYNKEGFTQKDQERLADLCHEITKAGGFFILSNSVEEGIMDLYRTYNIRMVTAYHSVGAKKSSRANKKEVLISNFVK
jgi:DNA adenine methylase